MDSGGYDIRHSICDNGRYDQQSAPEAGHGGAGLNNCAFSCMVAGFAHEISTPIGVCAVVVSRLKELTADAKAAFDEAGLTERALGEYLSEAGRGIDIAMANVARAADMIRDSKSNYISQPDWVYEELNAKEAISSIVENIRPLLEERVGWVEVAGPENAALESCYAALSQIFANLLMNSVMHAFEGKPKEICGIAIDIVEEERHVRIKYSDNGRGMDEKELEKLFQPFYTTRDGEGRGGLGLGMNIVLALVTQVLGGEVCCASAPGQGASFIIAIPKKYVKCSAKDAQQPMTTP